MNFILEAIRQRINKLKTNKYVPKYLLVPKQISDKLNYNDQAVIKNEFGLHLSIDGRLKNPLRFYLT